MAKAQTIDNLDVRNYIQYAQTAADEEIRPLINSRESQIVSRIAEADVMRPFALNEYDVLFGTNQRNSPWSVIDSPQGYDTQSRRIFLSGQVIPSLGSSEMLENSQRRVESQVSSLREQPGTPSSLMNETLSGAKSIIETLQLIKEFDHNSEIVLEKANQFHRG